MPGVIIALNDDDDDSNGVADWQQSGSITSEDDLIPMNIAPPAGMASGTLQLRIASGANKVRVWSNPQRTGTQLLGLGASSANVSWDVGSQPSTVWVEGVKGASTGKGDIRFALFAQPTGDPPLVLDAVRATVVKVKLLVGANDANDESVRDDWVGAKDLVTNRLHTINNAVRVHGPPGTAVQLHVDDVRSGSGSIELEGFDAGGNALPVGPFDGTITVGADGLGRGTFFIRGVAASSAPEDVKVRVGYKGSVVSTETMTVIAFNYAEEVGSEARPLATMATGNYIVNPAVRHNSDQVFAFDVGVWGSSSAVLQHDASHLAGTSPALVGTDGNRTAISSKFDVRNIEVMFGRRIQGSSAGSGLEKLGTDGSTPGSELSVAPAGINGAQHQSNLRIMDSATTGTGVDGNEYVYYLAHPTESLKPELGIEGNYANKVVVPTRQELRYTVNVTVLSYQPPTGPVETTGITGTEALRLITEASRLWEQIGVRLEPGTFTALPATTTASEWNVPNDDQSTLTGITTKSRANGLDVFFVNSINSTGGFLKGATAYENLGTVGNRETGTIVARRDDGPTSAPVDLSTLARTMAHEIGHLIFNSADHDPRSWNLMRSGDLASYVNADLSLDDDSNLEDDVGFRDNIAIGPDSYNVDETW